MMSSLQAGALGVYSSQSTDAASDTDLEGGVPKLDRMDLLTHTFFFFFKETDLCKYFCWKTFVQFYSKGERRFIFFKPNWCP